MGKRMGDAAAVADDIESFVFIGHEFFVDFYFHVIEFYFYAIEKGVIVCGAGCDLIESIDHFDNSVEDTLRKNKGKVAGSCVEGRGDESSFDFVFSGTASADKVAETLDDNSAAKHIGKSCNTFAIAVGIFERFGKMFCNKKSEVGVFGLFFRILIAVSVNGDDAVGVFVNDCAFGVHAESTDKVAVFLGAVNDLAFIKFIGKVGENFCGKFNANADINAVGLGGNAHFAANFFHPFASASADGDDAFFAGIVVIRGFNGISAFECFDGFNRSIEEEIDFVLKVVIDVFENDVVDVGAKMANGSIKEMKVVLDAEFFEFGAGGGIKFCACAAVCHVNFINIAHQFKSLFFADIFIKGAAEIVGDIIFSVRKSACTAKTAHDGTGFAADAAFYFIAVNGAAAFLKGMSGFKNRNFEFRTEFCKFVSGKNTAGTCADDDNVIIHKKTSEGAKFNK